MKAKCIICGNEIEIKDEICILGRRSGKTILALQQFFKRYCCSEECMDKYIALIKNTIYEVNE